MSNCPSKMAIPIYSHIKLSLLSRILATENRYWLCTVLSKSERHRPPPYLGFKDLRGNLIRWGAEGASRVILEGNDPSRTILVKILTLTKQTSSRCPQLEHGKGIYFIQGFPYVPQTHTLLFKSRFMTGSQLGFEVSVSEGACVCDQLLQKRKWMFKLTFEVIWCTLGNGQLEVNQFWSPSAFGQNWLRHSALPLG